ncbi:MAG: glycoside hydrolase family 2 protein, partial [Coriobacteriaceae bacterium]|nr:glycoside hydrolase family 2 protein [Coriobacteriaceae bacterium]
YQCVYHEYMAKFFAERPWVWASHVWNMFDFAADARDQGGEPGMNHKGLVTFDRKTKKDAFYIYKAYWSDEPFVHLCGRRYVDRPESTTTVKVYTNQRQVTLYANGEGLGTQTAVDHKATFSVPLTGKLDLRAAAGECSDEISIRHVDAPNPGYRLHERAKQKSNWADNE